jgi:hypothetical protein
MVRRYLQEVMVDDVAVCLKVVYSRSSLVLRITARPPDSTTSRFIAEFKLVSDQLRILELALRKLAAADRQLSDKARNVPALRGYEKLLQRVAQPPTAKRTAPNMERTAPSAGRDDAGRVILPRVELLRQRHPSAYLPWAPEDEKLLVQEFSAGVPIADLVIRLGRQEGGITARLKKLGLLN